MAGRNILALDLATSTGVAIGRAGDKPTSYSVRLKKPDEGQDVAFANMIAFLDKIIVSNRPSLVLKEAMMPLEGLRQLNNSEASVRLQAGLHAIVEAMCVRHKIWWDERQDSTVRKHFIGVSRVGTREATKKAVIQRCHLLGLMPRTSTDDNRADAIALHDYASAHLARTPPQVLHLFGEKASTTEGVTT